MNWFDSVSFYMKGMSEGKEGYKASVVSVTHLLELILD